MIKKNLKNFTKNLPAKILLQEFLSRCVILLLFFSFASSCTDQGCIEADDFGEYQQQTLTIPSNNAEDACAYNSTLPLFDAAQGSEVKTCFTSGAATVTDENNASQTTVSGGCSGNQSNGQPLDAAFKNLCIVNCIQACQNGSGVVSLNPEPNWIATDQRSGSQNMGVTILPGSKITITAKGTLMLGDSSTYPELFIPGTYSPATDSQSNFKDKDWTNDFIFDTKVGQSLNVKFSGRVGRSKCTGGGTYDSAANTCSSGSLLPNYIGTLIGAGATPPSNSQAFDNAVHNGARALVAYVIPHPAGYAFNSLSTTEKGGTTGAPLLPDPAVWSCTYTGSTLTQGASLESDCASGLYSAKGYLSSVDAPATAAFPITSTSQSPNLGSYGGIIRWSGDNLRDAYYDPWYQGSQESGGGVVPTTGRDITNNKSYAISVTFVTNNRESANCGDHSYNMTATVKDAAGTLIKPSFNLPILSQLTDANQVSVTLEPGQILNVKTPASGPCANFNMADRYIKHLDIPITTSGFVSFTTLNASSGSCTLNGRIINPNGSFVDFLDVSGATRSTDHYEYDDFLVTPSKDPLDALAVPVSGSTMNWSNKVFVRKGQVIRLSPKSWLGTFTTGNSLTRQCGVGMAMQLTPRPALLCKGSANETVSSTNSACRPDVSTSTGAIIGCQAVANECSDNTSSSYCPYSACSTVTCTTNGTSANNFAKTGCSVTTDATACNNALTIASVTGTAATTARDNCTRCAAKMRDNALLPAFVDAAIDQCYDLENYTGKAENIPSTIGFSAAQLADSTFAKGAKKLSFFNGSYGNFDQYGNTGTVDNSSNHNLLYQSKSPLMFSAEGRLKFLILNNDYSFRTLGTNYSTASASLGSPALPYTSLTETKGATYTGRNGFRVNFSGALQANNGQWLEAKLCKETRDNSCRGSTVLLSAAPVPTTLSTQPHLVEIVPPVATADPVLTPASRYYFDAYGTLIRKYSGDVGDCSAANQGIDTTPGVNYYCHTYLNDTHTYVYTSSASAPFSDADYDSLNKLRLTFKIQDPEVPTCYIPTSSHNTTTVASGETANGISMRNPMYTTNCSTANDGVNDGYDANLSVAGGCNAVTGLTCTNSDGITSSSSTTTVCHKQFYCGSKYSNNTGKYYVTVKVENPPGTNISNIIGGVITPIVQVMDGTRTVNADGTVTTTVGQAQRIYTLLVLDSRYQAILSMCMVVMIAFYGLSHLMGVSEMTISDLMNRGIKIALIYFFASPDGWYWFNKIVVNFFKGGTDFLAFTMASSFDDSTQISQALSTNDYYDKSVLFGSVDKVFGMFFSQAVQKKISALLFASIFGWAYLWIIYLSFMLYVYAVGNAVLYYLTAQVFISILFTLGPIFFIFTLFNQTKGMFDKWIEQLIGFSLQQIFLLTTLAFFNMMMYEVLKMSLGYKICWDEVWSINIITRISLLSFWTVASLPPRTDVQSDIGNIGHPEGIPSLFSILFIWVIAELMNSFITFMNDLGATIGGSLKASSLSKGIADTLKGAHDFASKNMNDIIKARVGTPIDRLDAALFDSGEKADKERKLREDKNRNDQRLKTDLSKAGDSAMSQYKRENLDTFSKQTPEQQKAALAKAKNDGMQKRATQLGVNSEDLARLKSDKGLKYEGHNLLVAGMQAARQKAGFGGGTLNTSLNEEKVSTKLSSSDKKAGMKNMDATGRGEFEKKVAEGKVQVDDSNLQKAANILANPVSAAKDALKNAAKKMQNASGGGEWAKARDQLVANKEINEMSAGTEFLRPKAEKDKIQKQLEQNREEKSLKSLTMNSGTVIAALAAENRNITRDEDTARSRPMATAAAAAIFGPGALGAMSDTAEAAGKLPGAVIGAIGAAGSAVSSTASGAAGAIGSAASSVAKAASTVVNDPALAREGIKNALMGAPKSAVEAASSVAGAASAAFGAARDLPSNVSDYMNPDLTASKESNTAKTGERIKADLAAIRGDGSAANKGEKKELEDKKNDATATPLERKKAEQSLENVTAREGKLEKLDRAMDSSLSAKSAIESVATTREQTYAALSDGAKRFGGTFASKSDKKTIAEYKEVQAARKEYGALSEAGVSDKAVKKHEEFSDKYKHVRPVAPPKPPKPAAKP